MELSEPGAGLQSAARTMAAGTSGKWLRGVSQLGLISRGVVYLLVGWLSWRLALVGHGHDAQSASSNGAVAEVAGHSWGVVALLVLAAGFASYALTQLVELIFRPNQDSHPIHQWHQRLVSGFGCLLYGVFCATTLSLLAAGRRPTATPASEQRETAAIAATILRTGGGRALALLIGVVVVLAGAELGRRSVRLTFQERFTSRLHPAALGRAVRGLGAAGCVARAAVFILVGCFIFAAAVRNRPSEVKGLDATFRSVSRSPYGPVTLAALASGLLCYGLYCLVESRYRDPTPGS